jgi:tetratricopeptide (TPR) repeat protein
VTPAAVFLAPPAVPEARVDESLSNQVSLVFHSGMGFLARWWRWLALTGALVGALAVVLMVRGHARALVLAGADAGDHLDSAGVAAQAEAPLVSLDAAATETQAALDAEETDVQAAPANEEPAPVEETHKREASPRPRAVRIAPSAVLSLAESGKILQDGQDFLRAQRFDEALSAFEKLVQSGKSRGPALVGLAKIAFQKHEYQEAVDRARESARAGGGAEARVVLGDAYFRLEKFADARKAYEAALKLDPNNRTARQNLDLIERRGY